jgi:hypothetical protein
VAIEMVVLEDVGLHGEVMDNYAVQPPLSS